MVYNPLQARDSLGKWVKEHSGTSVEDIISKTNVTDLENLALDDRTPIAVLNNLATTEYGFNHPFDEDKTYPNANGEPPKDKRENRYNYEQQLARYDTKVRCTAIERGADDTALSVCRFDDNPQIRNVVARNTEDAHTLDVLSSDESWKVRGAVAGNPHTPKNVAERLLNDNEAIVRAEALKRSDLSSEQIRKAVNDALEPTSHKAGAVTDDMTKIIRAASGNWQTDADTLHECLRVDDYETRRNVAEHEHTSQEDLHRLASSEDSAVREQVAFNPHASSATLSFLSYDDWTQTRVNVAGNPNTTPDTLEYMSNQWSPHVKRAIAVNSNASVDTLRKLSHDSDKTVRRLAYSGLKQKGEKPIDKPFKPDKPVEDDNPGKYMSADFDPAEFFGLND